MNDDTDELWSLSEIGRHARLRFGGGEGCGGGLVHTKHQKLLGFDPLFLDGPKFTSPKKKKENAWLRGGGAGAQKDPLPGLRLSTYGLKGSKSSPSGTFQALRSSS